jgi:muconolactone delta-isomerase
MEYLVTMTTHVPDGTPAEAVDDVRAQARPVRCIGRRLPERVTATSCRSCWWPPSSWSECCQGAMPVRASLSSRWPGWVVRLSC